MSHYAALYLHSRHAMCQAASLSPTEHVQYRPPALHVRRGYARDIHRDEQIPIPKGGKCNFNHLFFVFMLSAIILWLCLLLCLVVVPALSPHRQL